jgi:hypothetical protein
MVSPTKPSSPFRVGWVYKIESIIALTCRHVLARLRRSLLLHSGANGLSSSQIVNHSSGGRLVAAVRGMMVNFDVQRNESRLEVASSLYLSD